MKKFLLRLLWVLPFFLTIGGLNYFLDVKSLFHREVIDEAVEWLHDGNDLLEVHLANNRYLQKKYVETLTTPNEVVVLGQSRCNKIGEELFPNRTFFNHWAPRGTVYEILAFYNLYEKGDVLPKEIIIGLSPQSLNAQWKYKDKVLAQDFNEMCDKLGFAQLKVSFPQFRNQRFMLQELFSANYLITNFKYDKLVPQIALDQNHPAIYLSDGSSAQKSFINGPKNEAQARKIIEIEVLPMQHIKADEYALFEALLKYLSQSQNIEVSLFVLPYHPLIYHQEDLREPLGAWDERISNWATTYDIEVIGGLNPDDFDLSDDDYLDIDHVNRAATNQIFEMHRNRSTGAESPY